MRWRTLLPCVLVASPLVAQERPVPDSAARADTARGVRLPEVEAVARRVAGPAAAASLAVTDVGADAWQARRGAGLDDALAYVPGVVAQTRAGASDVRITIRGFGARGAGERSNAGTTRGIRVYLDGFPETEPDGRTSLDAIDLFALGRVAVVRSNAGTLWGNAAGGVVHLTSLAPEAPGAGAELLAGGFGLRRLGVRGSARAGGTLLGGSVTGLHSDGWRDHATADRWIGSAQARIPLARGHELGLFGYLTSNDARLPGPLTRAQLDSTPAAANALYVARDERRFNTVARLGAAWTVTGGTGRALEVRLFGQPKWLERSERGTYREFRRLHLGASAVGTLPLASADPTRTVLQLGTDLAWQDGPARFWSLGPDGGKGDVVVASKREGGLNAGIFAQVEQRLAPEVRGTLGARLDNVTYRLRDSLEPALDDERRFTRLVPKASLAWQPAGTLTLFASLGGGFEAPAFNETDPPPDLAADTVRGLNPLLEPIIATTVEAGLRQVIAPAGGPVRTLAWDLAAYHTWVRNELVPYASGRFYQSAATARRAGLEAGASATFAAGLDARVAVALTDNVYGEYVVDSAFAGRPGVTADYGGNLIVGLPRTTVSLGAGWQAGASPLRLAADLQSLGGYWADDANTVRVDGWTVLALGVATARPVRLGTLALGGSVALRNLLDARFAGSAYLNPDRVAGVPVAYEPGAGRHLVVSATVGHGGR